ncbi:MAG: HD domain-containing protein [Candidatus Krumholzibacteria bacterium]|nr:HD domain-containing protein [Candidatus Krumholzibacteria bacterium]
MGAQNSQRVISMKLIFSAVTVALVGLTVALVFAITERNARSALQAEMETRLVLEARNLALLSADALLDDYPELVLCPVVREMMQNQPDLTMAVVLDHSGRIKGHSDVRQLGQTLPMLDSLQPYPTVAALRGDETMLANDQVIAARVPSRFPGGEVVGTVLVAQDIDHINQILSANRTEVGLLAAALSLVGVLLALVFVRRALSPLDILRAGLERIGRGDLDSPIKLRNATELGLLADAIDNMAEDLKSSQAENKAKELEIIATQKDIICIMGEAVESRSLETGQHINRVADGSALLGKLAGLSTDECELLRMAAPMHDVGKIGIPDAVLNKPGKLTVDEYKLMQTHAQLGYNILSQSERPILKAAAIVALEHHEKWDGSGYPRGLAGEDIHIFGRVVAIVDVFDALASNRCYREAMPMAKALQIITDGYGKHFDPRLLDLFLENLAMFCLEMGHRPNDEEARAVIELSAAVLV